MVRLLLRVKPSLPLRKDSFVLFSARRLERLEILLLEFPTVNTAPSLMLRYSQEKTATKCLPE